MEISALGLLLGMLLLALPFYIIYAFDLRLMRRFCVSLARFAVMVLLCGGAVALLMHYRWLWLNIAVGVLLALLSSTVVVVKSRLPQGRLLLPLFAGSLLPLVVVVTYLLVVVMQLKQPLDTCYFVPVVSLLTGLSLAPVASALRAYYVGLEHHNELYYYLLGNGATHREAVRHFMRRGFQAALVPLLRRMSGLFVTTSPVLLLAMVMGGVGVWTAVFMELVLSAAVMAYVLSTFWLAILLSRRYAFDAYERLRPMKKTEDKTVAQTAAPASADAVGNDGSLAE